MIIAMLTHPIRILLLAVAGLGCVLLALRAAWHELCAYMRNQRFGE